MIEGLGTVEETYKAYASPAFLTREQVNSDLISYGWEDKDSCNVRARSCMTRLMHWLSAFGRAT